MVIVGCEESLWSKTCPFLCKFKMRKTIFRPILSDTTSPIILFPHPFGVDERRRRRAHLAILPKKLHCRPFGVDERPFRRGRLATSPIFYSLTRSASTSAGVDERIWPSYQKSYAVAHLSSTIAIFDEGHWHPRESYIAARQQFEPQRELQEPCNSSARTV